MAREVTRISHTLLKAIDGFRAELDGFDLPTLIQMVCARRARLSVRVKSQGREGLLYFDDGRVVHAVAPGMLGEAALLAMLDWAGGELTPCERPWPLTHSIHGSTESLLLRAAHQQDQARRSERGDEPSSVTKTRDAARRLEVVPSASEVRVSELGHSTAAQAVRASVRVSPNGEVLATEGDVAMFGELVAYVTRLGTVVGAELALDAFESLHAELGGERLVVFMDGPDTVGLLLPAGATAQELRKQLGH
jgi:hypothetical protein